MKTLLKTLAIAITLLVSHSAVAGFYGTFENMDLVPSHITSVKVKMFNLAKVEGTQGCGDTQCYRMDVFLNGRHVARWPVSPGRPHTGTDFVGNYTPSYSGRSLHEDYIYTNYTSSRGDSMPYAMFVKLVSGGKSPIAIHCGRVTGRRESHGCIRMVCKSGAQDAPRLNDWVNEAFDNGGTVKLWTRHTRP